MFASATGASPDVRALAATVMEEGFVTVDSNYQEQDEDEEAEEGDAKEKGQEEGKESLEIELPASLRHGIYICPPAKLEDSLRRCVVCF